MKRARGFNYQRVNSPRIGKSVFDLSYEYLTTCDMGQLIPVQVDEVVPGDYLKMGVQAVVRMQPLVSPIMNRIDVFFHTFFVPYRILWDSWESYITGGEDGDDASVLPVTSGSSTEDGLLDYLGFPLVGGLTGEDRPVVFPKYAYNLIFNEYYRDETLQTEVSLTDSNILNRNWRKDRFTASLPWQQRGTAPALPVTGTSYAHWGHVGSSYPTNNQPVVADTVNVDGTFYGYNTQHGNNIIEALNDNIVDLSSASTFNISDLRLTTQIQKWMERNARAGVRYTEYLKAHYDVSPRDDRLDRPEYIGGTRSPILVSEVLQTSSSDATSDQGNLAGHGITVNSGKIGNYYVKEHGLVMTLMSIMPEAIYSQGIDRQWLKSSRYDYFCPEFQHLSEVPVYREELYLSAVESENRTIFGYQGIYDEHRVKHNIVTSKMRPGKDYDYWTMSRYFSSAPSLNETFIKCDGTGSDLKRVFASETEPGFIVRVGNVIEAQRPMTVIAVPI